MCMITSHPENKVTLNPGIKAGNKVSFMHGTGPGNKVSLICAKIPRSQLKVTFIIATIVLFLSISSVQCADFLTSDPITKDGISVKLLENTNYCDTSCYSVYEVCYTDIDLLNDFDVKFTDEKTVLTKDEYLVNKLIDSKYQIPNCQKITVYGKKNKYESIDNVPIIKGIEFPEFAWWNTSWLNSQEINVSTQDNLTNYQIKLFIDVTNNGTNWNWTNECLGRFRILNKTNDGELPYWIYGCSETNKNLTVWIKGNWTNENGTQAYIYYNNLNNVPSLSSPYKTMIGYDNFSTDSIANYTEASTTTSMSESISAGILYITFGATWSTLYYNQATANNVSLHSRVKQNGGSNQWITHAIRTSTDRQTRYFAGFQDSANSQATIKWVGGSETLLENEVGQTWTNQVDWFDFNLAVSGSHLENNVSYTNGTQLVNSVFTDSGVTGASGNYFGWSLQGANMMVDQWYARKYHYPEPSYIIGEEQDVEFENTSLQVVKFNITEFIISSTTPQPIINITFDTPILAPFLLQFTSNCEGITGTSNSLYARLTVNGNVINANKRICGVKAVGDVTSGGFMSNGFLVPQGLGNNILVEFNVSTASSLSVKNIDFNLLSGITSAGNFNPASNVDNIHFNVTGTTYTNVYNFTLEKIRPSSHIISGFFTLNASNTDSLYIYAKNYNTSMTFPMTARWLETSSDIGAFALTFVDNSTKFIKGNVTYQIYAKTRNGNTIDIYGDVRSADSQDGGDINFTSFFATNESTTLTKNVNYGQGTHKILSKTVTIDTGDYYTLSSYVTLNSTSGKHTPTIFLNSSKGTFCSGKNRTLASSLNKDYASIFFVTICDNLTVGDVVTWNLYLKVPTGESVTLLDEALSGFESSLLDVFAGDLPPIPEAIINPENNTIVYGETENITWFKFFEPNGQPITYNISLFNKDGSFNISINSSVPNFQTTTKSISINYSQYSIGNFNLVVDGCDTSSLCANTTHNITIISIPPLPPIPPSPTDNASKTYCYDLNNLKVFEYKIINGVANYTTEFKYCPDGCDVYNSRCRDNELTRMIYFMIFIVFMASICIIPILIVTRKTSKKKLKFIIDMFTLFIFIIIYLVTLIFLFTPFISFIGLEIWIAVFVLMFTLFMFVLIIVLLMINNLMKNRYT